MEQEMEIIGKTLLLQFFIEESKSNDQDNINPGCHEGDFRLKKLVGCDDQS